MHNSYNAPWRKLAFVALLGLGSFAAQAQTLNYSAGAARNLAGTYTDLGTTGTAIATANTDDANSAATPIGFTFNFNGTAFTDFVLNTNGLIRLGTAAPSSAAAFPAYAQAPETGPISGTNAADVNLIAPFNLDLGPGSLAGTEYRVSTTGTAPNRVCTIQWKNVSDKPQAAAATVSTVITTQVANISFQVKLYETTNVVEFVYGSTVAGTGTQNAKYAAVGIKGSSPTASVLTTKASTSAWSATTFLVGPYVDPTLGNAHNVRQTTMPDAGRTYRFNPVLPIDAATQVIYSLGKAPVSAPHVVQAVVTNAGTTALTGVPVTLGVTGATTFTDVKLIPSLAVGASATVTFSAYTPTTVGTNTLTVTAAATNDGQASNNAQTFSQLVTANNLSYTDQTQTVANALSVSSTTPDGVLAAKYTAPSQATVGEVRINFPANPNPSTYQVLVMTATSAGLPGTVLFTSPNQTRPATAGVVTVPVTGTVSVNGPFFIGVKEVSGGSAVGYQEELPLRPGTFYAQVSGSWIDIGTQFPARLALEAGFSSRVLATSAALSKAISVYPNPSSGLVKLDVRGANAAKGVLNASVINVLGQTVYTSNLKDNFINEVDLSALPNGIYTLKVQTGSEFTSRQLVLTK